MIVLVFDCSVPLVLRALMNSRRWKIIGTCYMESFAISSVASGAARTWTLGQNQKKRRKKEREKKATLHRPSKLVHFFSTGIWAQDEPTWLDEVVFVIESGGRYVVRGTEVYLGNTVLSRPG